MKGERGTFTFFGGKNMGKSKVITLRVPSELKYRLKNEAEQQGVSLNNLANYFLTTQLSQVEAISSLEVRLRSKSMSTLKNKVSEILDTVPSNKNVPKWDTIK
ncbi:MAG: hypothetical protein CSA32_02100 [Desulfobulbus propionicus]|nr:MAG: hypothetical protein CSA32_02100 [Desulfobulbus propionicus]